jgi:hypothetical protein
MHNTGLDLEKEKAELKGDEWVFGALSPKCIFSVPEDEREDYLPVGELQNIGEEKSGCVTRAYNNKLEDKFTYADKKNIMPPELKKWGRDNRYATEDGVWTFSDAYIEILSGTTRSGNSLKAPAHAIYEHGLVPKSVLPQLDTWDSHYNPIRITKDIKNLGLEFKKRFTINYEQVFTADMDSLLKHDMVGIAVYAWPLPENGEYPRTDLPLNHCVMAYRTPLTYIFDNYIDSTDGDFIKKLKVDYNIYDYGYRLYVSAQNVPSPLESVNEYQKVPLFTWLAKMIAWLFTKSGPMPEIPKEILPEKPVLEPKKPDTVPIKESRLHKWASAIELFESGGKDDSPSVRSNNPGNCKGLDGKFLVFKTYQEGYDYLCDYLTRSATDKHMAYVARAKKLGLKSSGDLNILQFIQVYTSGDSDEIQHNYANFIASRCNTFPSTRIGDLL